MTTITNKMQAAVLPLTFKETKGVQECEIWNSPYSGTYAIGVNHCPPVNSEFVEMALVDFDQYNKIDRLATYNFIYESTSPRDIRRLPLYFVGTFNQVHKFSLNVEANSEPEARNKVCFILGIDGNRYSLDRDDLFLRAIEY